MPSLCRDLPEITFSSERTRIAKKEGQNGLGAFVPWIKAQADSWCMDGLCSKGGCVGHLQGTQAELLEETDEYIEVRFSTKISCRCEGERIESPHSTPNSGSSSSPTSGCCTPSEEEAEFQTMLQLYTAAVNNARADGYQAGNDPGYSDPGLGFHRVGNCADWQQVAWAALVTRTWRCWRVQKIRARQHWTLRTFHHFVKLEAVCSGRIIFLDAWASGKPEYWEAAAFPCLNGWGHTVTHTHQPGAPGHDPGND
ncbi:MAG TPA: hypothetical protein PLX89_14845 [Verrucomicrobiota bacterium]|nr:hypothetical protein [Verrucomicrobiales bacterium]HRI14269.1 hypothetical protein [Verrucomicrobiota bacterium]